MYLGIENFYGQFTKDYKNDGLFIKNEGCSLAKQK
jgi:hypothetical protein